MSDASATNDMFRFVLLRGPRRASVVDGVRAVLDLQRERSLTLAALPILERQSTARELFQREWDIYQTELGSEIATALVEKAAALGAGGTDELRLEYESLDVQRLSQLVDVLADAIVTGLHARISDDLVRDLTSVYRLAALATDATVGAHTPVAAFRTTPIVLTSMPDFHNEEMPPVGGPVLAPDELPADRLLTAITELAALDRAQNLNQPSDDGTAPSNGPAPYTLSPAVIATVSGPTQEILQDHDLDVEGEALTSLITTLEAALWDAALTSSTWPPPTPTVGSTTVSPLLTEPFEVPFARIEQVAQHLVVRQHLKEYEPIDVAHIQNLLPKETNNRTHRALDRTDTTRTFEFEETHDLQTEHETAQRTDVNIESAQAVEEQAQRHINLSLSGRYGPSVEFSSELDLDSTTVDQQSSAFATSFAKSVTDRTVERIGTRLRTSLVVRTESETEETNVHGLTGPATKPFRGIYHYVDKIYEAQAFDIGARAVVDVDIPEPGAFLIRQRLPQLDAAEQVTPPPRLAEYVSSQADIDELTYLGLCGRFGVSDPPLPPPRYRTIVGTDRQPPAGQPPVSEVGTPRALKSLDLPIPEGYRPWRATVRTLFLTDDKIGLGISMPGFSIVWTDDEDGGDLTDDHRIDTTPTFFIDLSNVMANTLPDATLQANVLTFETGDHATTLELVCRRTPAAIAAWQAAVYRELVRADERLRLAYEADLAATGPVGEPTPDMSFGISPTEIEEVLRDELKRSCMTILLPPGSVPASDQTFDPPDDTVINTSLGDEHARVVRFMEQSFEWENLQYVLYPYFWGRRAGWEQRLQLAEEEPELRRFLQAGAARVVVPLRPGFDRDVATFLATSGAVMGGGGAVIPDKYVPIDQELRNREEDGPDGIIFGDPWDVRVPTRLTYVRDSEELPGWERDDPGGWSWELVR